jgi:hypothetical protein
MIMAVPDESEGPAKAGKKIRRPWQPDYGDENLSLSGQFWKLYDDLKRDDTQLPETMKYLQSAAPLKREYSSRYGEGVSAGPLKNMMDMFRRRRPRTQAQLATAAVIAILGFVLIEAFAGQPGDFLPASLFVLTQKRAAAMMLGMIFFVVASAAVFWARERRS